MRPHVEHVGAFLLGLAERHSDLNEGGRRLAVKAMFDFKRVAVIPRAGDGAGAARTGR